MGSGSAQARLIDAVEAIYFDIERQRPDEWLAGVVEHVDACVSGGRGALGHVYDLRGAPRRWSISKPIVRNAPDTFASVLVDLFAGTPPEDLHKWYGGAGPAGTFSEVTGVTLDQLPPGRDACLKFSIRDQVYVNAANPDCDGLMIVVNLSERTRLGAGERTRLSLLAAHAAAAQRLVHAVARGAAQPAVIFEKDGRVAHVEGPHESKIASLRERLTRIDRARGKMRRTDPEGALTSWKALLSGAYSLVDRFESDQRRYVVAFVNEPNVLDPRGLTRSEAIVASWAARGHSDKVIAYELGLAKGTVSALLARAYRKLRVRTRAALVTLLQAPSQVERVRLDDGADVLLFSAPSAPGPALDQLTRTERQVAVAASRGDSNRTIATARKVSEATVAKQLASIYAKLGVSKRAELSGLLAAGGSPTPLDSASARTVTRSGVVAK